MHCLPGLIGLFSFSAEFLQCSSFLLNNRDFICALVHGDAETGIKLTSVGTPLLCFPFLCALALVGNFFVLGHDGDGIGFLLFRTTSLLV